MNWFTQSTNVTVTLQDDCCPHLKVGDVAAARTRENDSFGPVDSYCMCSDCYKEYIRLTTPYDVKEDLLLEVMKATTTALLRCSTEYNSEDESEALEKFYAELTTAKSVGFSRIKGSGKYPNNVYTVYIGDQEGNLLQQVAIQSVSRENVIMARHIVLYTKLISFIEHDVGQGVWLSIPVKLKPDQQNFLPLEGTLVSSSAIRSIVEPGLPASYRWAEKPDHLTIDPLDDYEDVVCCDCLKTVFVKDTTEWKPYDFYAPQGDEPLCICNECKGAKKHRERVARDRAACDAELGQDDDDDYEDGGPDYNPNDFDEDDPDRE